MLMKKSIGKPYAGKPHVRFDEGVGKVLLTFPLYSTGKNTGTSFSPRRSGSVTLRTQRKTLMFTFDTSISFYKHQ